jgi:hypothetical protein
MSFYIKPERNGDIDSIFFRAGKAYPILRGDRFTKTKNDILEDGVVLIDNMCYHVRNCEQGFKVYQGKEITDPVLKDWGAVVTKSNNSLFKLPTSRLDGELCDWFHDNVAGLFISMPDNKLRDRLDCLNPFRSQKFVGKISITKSHEDRVRERETAMKVGKAIRMIFPELSDVGLGQVVDRYNLEFGSKDFTLHKSNDPKVFASVYKEENHAPMGNPKTTNLRKSIACSCMRYSFEKQSHHPAYVYGSGDFTIYYTKDSQGRTGSRCVVYHTDKTDRPQAGPIYGVCEHSMNKIQDALDKIDAQYVDPDWTGAKLLHIPHGDGVIGPYLDVQPRSLAVVDNKYLEVTECGDYDASCYSGVLGDSEYCCDCGDPIHEDNTRWYCDNAYCEDCFYERYDYCEWTDDYYPHDDMVMVQPQEIYVWRDHDNVIYIEDLDEFWDSDECRYSDKLDKWIPADQMSELGYFECWWTGDICKGDEWAETTDGEVVCISALEEKGWDTNDDGLWYDPEEEKDSTEGDKKKEDYPIEEVKEFNKKLRR